MSLLNPAWQTSYLSLKETLPWQATSFGEYAEIEAYDLHTKSWEIIADIRPIGSLAAEDLAHTITEIINTYEKGQETLREAVIALEMCFVHERLSDKARQRIKNLINSLDKT